MPKKTFLLLSTIFISALFAAACQPTVTLAEADCTKIEVLCVGLVTSLDGINDNSYNQQAWEGVLEAQSEKTVDWVRYIETVDVKDYYQNVSSLAQAGYDVIVTVGEQNAEVTTTAANNYPEALFIGVDQDQGKARHNLVGLVFHTEETGFLAGVLAAQITKNGTIAGVFGAESIPSIMKTKEGYEAGARFINPNINIISNYYPGDPDSALNDAKWGTEAAAKAIENGADVIFGAGGRLGNGALLETAKHPGFYCIGVDYDQWESISEAHPCLLSSAVKLISPGISDLIELAKDGKFPSGNYFGESGLAPYHDFDAVVQQTAKDKINKIAVDLNSGSINIGALTP
jgi:basic membrane protein A